MSTTWNAIRTAVQDAIKSVTPTSLSGYLFKIHDVQGDFRDWCEDNAAACFRRFQVRDLHEYDDPEVHNADVEWRQGEFEIMVGYPLQWNLYAQDTNEARRSFDDFLHEDELSIRKATWHPSGIYTSDTVVQDPQYLIELRESVAILSITYPFGYYRSTS